MDEDTSSPERPRRQASVLENAVSLRGAARALVAQVWIYNRLSKDAHHVLSQAALVPDELPLIDVPRNWSVRLGKESEWTAYGETSLLRSDDALSWYDKIVHAGEWAPPWRKPNLSQPVAMLGVLSEPAGPSVVTTQGDATIPPVRGREVGTRHHHVLCEEPTIPKVLDEEACRKLLGALRDHSRVDLEGMPELWQSAHDADSWATSRFLIRAACFAWHGADVDETARQLWTKANEMAVSAWFADSNGDAFAELVACLAHLAKGRRQVEPEPEGTFQYLRGLPAEVFRAASALADNGMALERITGAAGRAGIHLVEYVALCRDPRHTEGARKLLALLKASRETRTHNG